MSEKVALKAMRCPTCGGSLKAQNSTDAIVCVYCGNTIVPVNEAASVSAPATMSGASSAFNGVLRVDGIKTSSSALAYIEQLYEEYDWEAFAYAQTLSIAEIDKLTSSLKSSSADDKKTWFVCFKAVSVPFLRKIEGCRKILASVIEEYKKDNFDAYSKFDAYKRIASMTMASKDEVVAKLKKFVSNAAKYGASSDEIAGLNDDIHSIVTSSDVELYFNIEEIPDVKAFIEEKNAKIARELASEGINADSEYARAKALIDEKNYAEALSVLLSLKGYSDSAELIKKIDKYYLISDTLEIEGNLYYFKKASPSANTLDLYPTANGKISQKPIITSIWKIITNYADLLYYLDSNRKLKRYNLSSKKAETIYNRSIIEKTIFVYDRRTFLLAENSANEGAIKNDIVELDLATGVVKTLIKNVREMASLLGNKMIYTAFRKTTGDSNESAYKTMIYVINVDTLSVTMLGSKKIAVKGFVNNHIVYTQEAPNTFNNNLYIKALDSDEPERLIEKNIYQFCDIIAGKLFYYVGNTRNQSLITINCDCTERREWPFYISDVLFEQGGWLYFIKKAGYNAILCKSRLDGSKFSVIAADIEEFIEIKNGYLYYINYYSTLVKVRMDGSNLQELCEDVESVLAVKEDKIIFVSIDGRSKADDLSQTTKTVKSIYAVDFSGSGKIKLAYDVNNAKNYDENTVYYVAYAGNDANQSPINAGTKVETLYKLDVETNRVEKLLSIETQQEENKGFAIAMIFMVISLFFGLIGFSAEAPGVGAFGLIGAVVSLIVGLVINSNKKE